MGLIKKNWILGFLVVFLVMLIVLSLLGVYLNGGIECFFSRESDDKRLDVMSSIILASITGASAVVAIVLARTALLYAENEEKREFKNRVEERIRTIQEINNNIIFEARKFGNNMSSYFENQYSNTSILPVSPKFKIKNLIEALQKIEKIPLLNRHYKENMVAGFKNYCVDFKNYLTENNFKELYSAKVELPEILYNLEIKSEQNDEIILDKKVVSFMKMHKKISEEFKKKFREEYEAEYSEKEYLIWLNISIILSQFNMKFDDKTRKQTLKPYEILNIFLNLPYKQNFIDFSNNLDIEFWETNRDYAIETIDILTKSNDYDKFRKMLFKIKAFLIHLENSNKDIFSYSLVEEQEDKKQSDTKGDTLEQDNNKEGSSFKKFEKLLKGIMIKHNQEKIDANTVFNAFSYVDLSPYATAVMAKMMGEHFYRITPAEGAKAYLDIAEDNKKDITYDKNMETFMAEMEKYLGNENFIVSIR